MVEPRETDSIDRRAGVSLVWKHTSPTIFR